MSHTLSAPLLSRLSSLSAELSELCGLCDLLADPMPRNFIQASLRTLSDMAEDASETLGQFADATRGSKRRILPALLDGYGSTESPGNPARRLSRGRSPEGQEPGSR